MDYFLEFLLTDHNFSVRHNPLLNLDRVNSLCFVTHTLSILCLHLLFFLSSLHCSHFFLLSLSKKFFLFVVSFKFLYFLVFLQIRSFLLHQFILAFDLQLPMFL